jgi:lipopolysaccharide export system protein LptC
MAAGHNKRVAHRWRVGSALVLALLVAGASFYWLQVMNVADMDMQSDAHRNEPDYIVENFSLVRMGMDGKPRTIIAGRSLSHRPADDSGDIVAPYVQNMTGDKPPMTMQARTGHLDNVAGTVLLRGGVHIERAADPAGPGMTLDTASLLLTMDTQELRTDDPVRLTSGRMIVTGTGLQANNTTGMATIARDPRIELPPK